MRFETVYASQYLVRRLQYAHSVTHVRDEGDIILITLQSGKQVMILMVERGLNLNEVRYQFETNTKQGIYTLMILWVDMFIARDGAVITMPDWMIALDGVHQGKIYGFEPHGRDAFFFPVYLEGKSKVRTVRYGNVVNYAHIGGEVVDSDASVMRGRWRIASFDYDGQGYSTRTASERYRQGSPLAVYYAALDLKDGAELAQIKRAYRQMARKFHPDINTADDAHEQMASINDAYQRLLQHFAGD